jgi:release factor glutamine methyltransferase
VTTSRGVLTGAADVLRAAGVASPRVDAELLLAHCLGVERSRLLLIDVIPPAVEKAFAAAVARRITREPLQYILGQAPFRHIVVAVGPGVFVPRPETELLVDAVLPTLRAAAAPVAVDLCAGSGALALAVVDEAPGTRAYAVENSPAALPWLRRNTLGTGVVVLAHDVRAADGADGLARLRGTVDAVVCNPPYVPTSAAATLPPEVGADPVEAIFAGPDGLDLMPAVLARAAELLRSGGVAAIEHDDTHSESLPALLAAHGNWDDVVEHHDLAGLPRYVTALRR